ncbi:Disrupted in renal carcinoma protein 2-like [Hondaea fermentalgiana]|uniref:Disrupted in renal carcinoma protein 2-like n=1 Tax=Hondaea fermentalgiana TaxID=2315210 RepID=A0A2R5GD80_9STRA|nr:Disrupted in renal carcinoma protein 2-like [Hondaea fermentalgiana]|eukprot:GBG28259.1 Disrupted in renal carcinoma protein 2-like [Hondaea fermentalgiana]
MSKSSERSVELLPDGSIKVYPRRWAVLASVALCGFGWTMNMSRQVPLSPTYAKHFNVPNQAFSRDDNNNLVLGIDFLTTFDALVLICSYIVAAKVVSRWGLRMLTLSSFCLAFSAWMWYAADDSYFGVLGARTITSIFAPCISSSILVVSNVWFPENERAKGTAVISLFLLLGTGAALIVGPMLATSPFKVVDLTLRSCNVDKIQPDLYIAYTAAQVAGEPLSCEIEGYEYAEEEFCCYLPVNLRLLDLIMAIFMTVVAFITLVSVRNEPPTLPSPSAGRKADTSIRTGLHALVSSRRFLMLTLSDFIISGPVSVLYYAMARMFPPAVSSLSFVVSAIGLALAIPTAILAAHLLDKRGWYYTTTVAGYTTGTLMWILATIAFATETSGLFIFGVVLALSLFIAWQTAVFETKLEYVFTHQHSLETYVISTDRIIIQIGKFVFVSCLVPEVVGGALNTYGIGCGLMVVGCLPVLFIRDRYLYLRQAYDHSNAEAECQGTASVSQA